MKTKIKRHVLLASLFLCSTINLFAQQRTCGTPVLPLEFEEWINQFAVQRNSADPNAQVAYVIPTIVHIIHNGEAVGTGTNISQAQVTSQFTVLNKDFTKTNADFSSVCPAVFQAVAANCQITFCKALRKPSGVVLTEAGIDRVNRNTMGWSAPPYSMNYITSTIKPATIYNPSNYLNIWVCDMSNGLLGFATFPANSTLTGLSAPYGTATTDGVAVLYNAFGSVGNVGFPYDLGRSATHEIGHWLGLRHIWGDAGCGNDYCNDTPTQSGPNYAGCPPFPQVTCGNGPNGDMWVNYMDYVTDACMVMFTANQKTRMQTCMANGTYRVPLANSLVCSPLGIPTEAKNTKFNIYPNPSTGMITVDAFNMGSDLNVRIFNVVGALVKEMRMENAIKFDVDLTAADNGMYFMELDNGHEKVTQLFSLSK